MSPAVPSLMPPSRRSRDLVEERIGAVLDGGAFANPFLTMVLQPVVDLRNGRVIGAEALARFKTEPYRTPDLWFEDARRSRLGLQLELLAIEIALAKLGEMPPETYLAVNASPETLVSEDLRQLVGKAGGSRIVVELTEHARVDDYAALQTAVAWLRARGVRLAVDDAGAGFASFQHILRLQPDIIKLDRSLTSGVDANPVRYALASAMVTFAASLGAKICAEGIETASEIVALQRLGIACGQGYYLGKPGPLPLASPPPGMWLDAIDEDASPQSIISPILRSPARLASLQATGLLDTDADEAFDRFTRLAARLLGAPISLISLIDDKRQFFKSALGAGDVRETPIAYSICANTVSAKSALIVEDARIHPLIRNNPAIPAFGIGAYAGVPIVTVDDQAIGALCVIDTQPHAWSEDDVATLVELGRLLAEQIDLRKKVHALERRSIIADAVLEHTHAPVLVYNVESRLERASHTARILFGRSEDELRGVRSADLVHPDDQLQIMDIRDRLLSGWAETIHAELRYPSADGSYPLRRCVGSLVRDTENRAALFVVTLGDIIPNAA